MTDVNAMKNEILVPANNVELRNFVGLLTLAIVPSVAEDCIPPDHISRSTLGDSWSGLYPCGGSADRKRLVLQDIRTLRTCYQLILHQRLREKFKVPRKAVPVS
jgi:hypothetical protein